MANYVLTVGNDTLTGTEDGDVFDGHPVLGGAGGTYGGIDTLDGGAGNDTFLHTAGTRGTIDGGDGVDTVVAGGRGVGAAEHSLTTFTNVEILDVREFYSSFRIDQLSAFTTIKVATEPFERPSFHLFGQGGVLDFSTRINVSIYVALHGVTGAVDLTGTAHADRFTDSEFDDTLNGGDGSDWIEQIHGGFDTIRGGAGDDLLNIVSGMGIIDGGSGTDTLNTALADISGLQISGIEILRPKSSGFTATIGQLSGIQTIGVGLVPINIKLTGGGGDFDLSKVKIEASQVAVTSIGVSGSVNIIGSAARQALSGSRFEDKIDGGGGDDTLSGGAGRDTLIGGAGNDSFDLGDEIGDVISDVSGTDIILTSISRSLAGFSEIESLTLTGTAAINGTGNESANTITGNNSANILDGGLGRDRLVGGFGNDTFIASYDDIIQEWWGQGVDTVRSSTSFTLGDNLENLVLIGTTASNGYGNEEDNSITGNAAANVLDGKAGRDRLQGGMGNDTYVTDGGDAIVEAAGQGTDTVRSSVSLTLGANLENLVLTGSSAINGTGNSLANTIIGNAEWNTLNGGLGADRLIGGDGSDVYVTDGDDVIIEAAGGRGTDSVRSSASITLASNVEYLWLTGTGAIDGTGNGLANSIYGNAGANTLTGGGGDDWLLGGGGNDRLLGGTGNDTYILSNGNDTVSDSGGVDMIFSTISRNLGAYAAIENLMLEGMAASNGVGNNLNNLITGNSAANTLDGGNGNDQLQGGYGQDTLVGGAGDDIFDLNNEYDTVNDVSGTDMICSTISRSLEAHATIENLALKGFWAINGSGNNLNNVITGNTAANTLNGGNGNDLLYGGAGKDTLIGGAGNDTFVFNTALDAGTNADRITDFNVAQDTIRLDNAVMTGLGNVLGTLSAGKFWKSNTGAAHDADDRIIYEIDTGKLFYDGNGNKAGGSIHVATLAANLQLTNADFVVV